MATHFPYSRNRGFGFIEVLVGTAVFAVVSVALYQSYTGLLVLVNHSRVKTIASALANEQFEIIRNLPYADVGIVNGVPAGKLPRFQTLTRSGISFQSTTTIRNVDNPFDGEIGSTTAPDLSPADYRFVAIEIGCATCRDFIPLVYSTQIAPKSLETLSTNGALFVKVFDANGDAVSGARVQVTNPNALPPVAIDEVTNSQGQLQLVDVPPGANQYRVVVSKSGYTTDQTYPLGDAGNPNPLKPDVTVALQQVTSASFIIDHAGEFNFSTARDTCEPVPSVPLTLSGTRLIGTSPDVLKYSAALTTNGAGVKAVSGLEGDTYSISLTGGADVLKGSIPALPLILTPGAVQNVQLILEPFDPRHLLVLVKDGGSGLPVSDALVRLEIGAYDDTLTTDRGFVQQTDWAGGGGQGTSTDQTKFFTSDGNIEYDAVPGEVSLKQIFGSYEVLGELVSSTFDLGSQSNFYQILWNPGDQPVESGADSVRFQIATNNDMSTWNFKGPDGTAGTYYTLSDQNISAVHSGDRYLRYKIVLSTASTTFTPLVSDVSIAFSSVCVPPGQVLFSGIPQTGQASLSVTKVGYQPYTTTVDINDSHQSFEVNLTP